MKKLLESIFIGKSGKASSLAVLAMITLIALGCTCDQLGANDNNSSRNDRSSNSSTPFGGDDDDSTPTKPNADADGVPSKDEAEAMVKDLTADFTDAIQSGDFSNIYNNASKDFKATYTLDQTSDVFKMFVDKKSLVVPILKKAQGMDAEFTTDPYIRQENGLDILVLNGKFSTKPVPTRFEYEFVKRDGTWQMLKLVVKLT